MEKLNCAACAREYILIGGHSCGDTPAVQSIREALANEKLARRKLEEELTELRHYLVPIAKHFSNEYNRWRAKNPKSPGWVEAGDYIRKAMKDFSG